MTGYSRVVGICRHISLEALEVLFPLLVLLQIALKSEIPGCLVIRLVHKYSLSGKSTSQVDTCIYLSFQIYTSPTKSTG